MLRDLCRRWPILYRPAEPGALGASRRASANRSLCRIDNRSPASIALAAAVDPGWSTALWTAGLFILAEGVTGQFLEPVLYGSSTGLSPTAVVIVAIFWSWIWGPIGLILSTPLTLCLVVVGRHVRHLEFFDVLFGDRPALTPVETLYQRLLAGDPDEILEQADTLLKGRALSSYYDDIALKALRLVARDTSRGVVQPAQLVKIQEAMLALILDLESHDDVDPVLTKAQAKAAVVEVAGVARPERETATQPAPEGQVRADLNLPDIWRTERSVLCIPGRGPLDGVAAAMLAQLLRKHGLGAQAAPSDAVSRSAISRLDTTGVAIVCVTYAELIGSPPHMRYLLRRVRQRFPLCPILVGFWEADDTMLQDRSAQELTGATEVTTSFHEAVLKCMEEAHKVRVAKPEPNHGADAPVADAASPCGPCGRAERPPAEQLAGERTLRPARQNPAGASRGGRLVKRLENPRGPEFGADAMPVEIRAQKRVNARQARH